MKILWFTNTPCRGNDFIDKDSKGSGGWLYSLDEAIQKEIELHVAFYHPKVKEPFLYGETHYYPINKGDFHLQLIKKIFKEEVRDREDEQIYLNLINEINPDLIHIHGTENSFGCIIGKVDIPILVSIQGIIAACYNKYNAGIEKKYLRTTNKMGLKYLFNGLFPYIRSYKSYEKMKEYERRNLAGCAYVMGRTDWDRRFMQVLAPKSDYFYGGEILRDIFYHKQWKPHDRKKLIINTTNSNAPYKGFETICKAVSLLNELSIDFEWRVAGISSDDMIVKVVKRKLGKDYPKSNLNLLGRLTDIELANSLMEADIYVMTSHIENSPNNLGEAMLLGLPCIATFVGGTSSMLSNGEEGILVQDGDPWSMVGAILEFKKDMNRAAEFGHRAREIAHKRHNKELVVRDILSAYKTILSKNAK